MRRRAPEPVMALGSQWIRGSLADSGSRVRLFCFPYAGGGATTYFSWPSLLRPKEVDACCIQLPGRDTRFSEMPIAVMDQLTAQICDGIEPYLDLPFSFFGHSMGTLISFEVARELLSCKLFKNVSSLFANESEFVIIGMHLARQLDTGKVAWPSRSGSFQEVQSAGGNGGS
jgi:pimeloyl-ACP methyl ester carboxylesterase